MQKQTVTIKCISCFYFNLFIIYLLIDSNLNLNQNLNLNLKSNLNLHLNLN